MDTLTDAQRAFIELRWPTTPSPLIGCAESVQQSVGIHCGSWLAFRAMKRTWIVIAVALLVMPACRHHRASHSTSTVTPTLTPGLVSEATWADGPWPLTVTEGQLQCDSMGSPGTGAVTFTAAGKRYALNGLAERKYPAIDSIWKADPAIPGAKINISPLLDAGLRLCR